MTARLKSLPLLPTCLVGSYAQPAWLIDRERLGKRLPPRVRAEELWRIAPAFREEAKDDATLLAIRDQERAGLDIVGDGEMRRESYSNQFANALDGIDQTGTGFAIDRTGRRNPVPRVVGRITRRHSIMAHDVAFLRANTDRPIRITLPGPFTMTQQAQNDFYDSEDEMAGDYAAVVNAEIKELFAAGADIVQLDEPYLQARPDKARQYGVAAMNRALDGVDGVTAVHLCFGYSYIQHDRPTAYSFLSELAACRVRQVSIETAQSKLDCAALGNLPDHAIILGVLDMSTVQIETPEIVAARIRRALPHVAAERLVIAPDCGFKYMTRDIAYAKMTAMVAGAALVRAELAGAKANS
ncbi:MAG: hypothetical protein ACREFC_02405 [Stellaceae bacterium]